MKNYQEEAAVRDKLEAAFPGFVDEVAEHLPGEWTRTPVEGRCQDVQHITREDGLKLSLFLPLYRAMGRIEISGCLPGRANGAMLSRYQAKRAKDITCAQKREPKAIARDIEVRLLEAAEAAHKAGLNAAKRLDEAAERRMAVHRHIAGLFGQSAGDNGRSEYGHFEGITCKVTTPQSFEISVRATDPEEATRILAGLSRITGLPLIKREDAKEAA